MAKSRGAHRVSRRKALSLAAATTAGGASLFAGGGHAAATPLTSPMAPPAQAPSDQFAPLEAAVREAMASSGIPGAAVGAVWPDGEYLGGFGVTNVDSPRTVDADTLFQIGSVTKTMTMA